MSHELFGIKGTGNSHPTASINAATTLTGISAEALDQLRGKLWVILLDQMIDCFLFDG